MIFTIHQGKHRARPWKFGLWFNRSLWRHEVVFLPSCRYQLPGADQLDINKLFGAGFVPWWKLWKPLLLLPNSHHGESARVGWRYNPTTDLIEIFSYCYVSGKPVRDYICDVRIGDRVPMSIQYTGKAYIVYVGSQTKFIQTWRRYSFSYRLGIFFGGNRPAPRLIQISIR